MVKNELLWLISLWPIILIVTVAKDNGVCHGKIHAAIGISRF